MAYLSKAERAQLNRMSIPARRAILSELWRGDLSDPYDGRLGAVAPVAPDPNVTAWFERRGYDATPSQRQPLEPALFQEWLSTLCDVYPDGCLPRDVAERVDIPCPEFWRSGALLERVHRYALDNSRSLPGIHVRCTDLGLRLLRPILRWKMGVAA